MEFDLIDGGTHVAAVTVQLAREKRPEW